ncbi:MAG: hypothetical protein GF353_17450 [Candidatus Lokiarchaeota archaeon]|nr:hypothetical protein [Candidatus Lokiarchaeota archaeon]
MSTIEITFGICDTIFVVVSSIIGIKLLLKYVKFRKTVFLTAPIAWLLLSVAWWGVSLSFIMYVLFKIRLNYILYLIIYNATIPLSLIFWIYTYCLIICPEKKKIIVSIFSTVCIIYEILLWILIFSSPELVATISGIYFIVPQLFAVIFKMFAVLVVLFTGIILAKRALNSGYPDIEWKGRFLLLAFVSFSISLIEVVYVGLFFEEISLLTVPLIIVFRILMISSVFEYYLGFFLPEKLANWLIKEKN